MRDLLFLGCKNVADRLSNASERLGRSITHANLHEIKHQIKQDGDALLVVMDLMYLINSQIPECKIRWCGLCFRRAVDGSRFCSNHQSGMERSEYDRGRKLWKQKPDYLADIIKANQRLRLGYGENVEVISTSGQVCEFSNSTLKIELSKDISDLLRKISDGDWAGSLIEWDSLIHKKFPRVATMLSPMEKYRSWSEFVLEFREVIKNKSEDTFNAYLVLCELEMAEEWQRFVDDKRLDGRYTGNKDQVDILLRNGLSQTEVAMQLRVTDQYVSKVKKNKRA